MAKAGHDVTSTADGREALLAARNSLPFLDMILPGPDPLYLYDLNLQPRANSRRCAKAMDAGADDFLTKAFDPPELKTRLLVANRIV